VGGGERENLGVEPAYLPVATKVDVKKDSGPNKGTDAYIKGNSGKPKGKKNCTTDSNQDAETKVTGLLIRHW